MASNRIQILRDRIKALNQFKQVELLSPIPSEAYIADLNNSIAGCKRELFFLKQNPEGVEFVNGIGI